MRERESTLVHPGLTDPVTGHLRTQCQCAPKHPRRQPQLMVSLTWRIAWHGAVVDAAVIDDKHILLARGSLLQPCRLDQQQPRLQVLPTPRPLPCPILAMLAAEKHVVAMLADASLVRLDSSTLSAATTTVARLPVPCWLARRPVLRFHPVLRSVILAASAGLVFMVPLYAQQASAVPVTINPVVDSSAGTDVAAEDQCTILDIACCSGVADDPATLAASDPTVSFIVLACVFPQHGVSTAPQLTWHASDGAHLHSTSVLPASTRVIVYACRHWCAVAYDAGILTVWQDGRTRNASAPWIRPLAADTVPPAVDILVVDETNALHHAKRSGDAFSIHTVCRGALAALKPSHLCVIPGTSLVYVGRATADCTLVDWTGDVATTSFAASNIGHVTGAVAVATPGTPTDLVLATTTTTPAAAVAAAAPSFSFSGLDAAEPCLVLATRSVVRRAVVSTAVGLADIPRLLAVRASCTDTHDAFLVFAGTASTHVLDLRASHQFQPTSLPGVAETDVTLALGPGPVLGSLLHISSSKAALLTSTGQPIASVFQPAGGDAAITLAVLDAKSSALVAHARHVCLLDTSMQDGVTVAARVTLAQPASAAAFLADHWIALATWVAHDLRVLPRNAVATASPVSLLTPGDACVRSILLAADRSAVFLGLADGVVVRYSFDDATGVLGDRVSWQVGSSAVRLYPLHHGVGVYVHGMRDAVLLSATGVAEAVHVLPSDLASALTPLHIPSLPDALAWLTPGTDTVSIGQLAWQDDGVMHDEDEHEDEANAATFPRFGGLDDNAATTNLRDLSLHQPAGLHWHRFGQPGAVSLLTWLPAPGMLLAVSEAALTLFRVPGLHAEAVSPIPTGIRVSSMAALPTAFDHQAASACEDARVLVAEAEHDQLTMALSVLQVSPRPNAAPTMSVLVRIPLPRLCTMLLPLSPDSALLELSGQSLVLLLGLSRTPPAPRLAAHMDLLDRSGAAAMPGMHACILPTCSPLQVVLAGTASCVRLISVLAESLESAASATLPNHAVATAIAALPGVQHDPVVLIADSGHAIHLLVRTAADSLQLVRSVHNQGHVVALLPSVALAMLPYPASASTDNACISVASSGRIAVLHLVDDDASVEGDIDAAGVVIASQASLRAIL